MLIGKHRDLAPNLQTLFSAGSLGDLTDGQILERFATGPSEVCERMFAALVERHGPMVLGVCRSMLFDPDDVEDAFQASFLVLFKKDSRPLDARFPRPLALSGGSPHFGVRTVGGSPTAKARAVSRGGDRDEIGRPRRRTRTRIAAGAPRGDQPAPGPLPQCDRAL